MVDSYQKFPKKEEKRKRKGGWVSFFTRGQAAIIPNLRNVLSNLCFVFQRPGTPALQDIFEKIRGAIHKNGIRTTEFFKDHDKLRSGEITENQVRKFFMQLPEIVFKTGTICFLFFFLFFFFFSFFNFKKCP